VTLNFDLFYCTPLTHALGNVCTNFDLSAFLPSSYEYVRDRRADGRARRVMRPIRRPHTVASERNQHCGARRGLKSRSSKLEGLSSGWGSWEGRKPPPHQLGGLGSAVSSPSGVRPRPPRVFVHFWVLRVNSPAVLLLDLGVINRDL